jgi:hypothetical protein
MQCRNRLSSEPGKKTVTTIEIDSEPAGKWKMLGGGDRDEWNNRQGILLIEALVSSGNNDAATAALSGMIDMKPADPVEGMLIGQIIAAHEAAMNLYRLGWLNVGEYFEAGTKYLQLADRATRTVAILTERLDQHRGRGQQQITVKHVTVNADQAVVTDQIVSDKGKETIATNLLTAKTDEPMEIIEPTPKTAVPVKAGGSESK